MCSRLQPSCVQVIQRVVRSRFPDSTILTIAHRLDTVIDYDHLLLMAEGRVAEARPTDMMCSVMCMCMYGVHTVAHIVAARQAAHINMPCTCTCTCTCTCMHMSHVHMCMCMLCYYGFSRWGCVSI